MRGIDNNDLHIIIPFSNHVRYASRTRLYHRFIEEIQKSSRAKVYTAELVLGDRDFMLEKSEYGTQHQFVTLNELWHKENLINLVIQRLPRDWRYVAWIDADIEFVENPHHGVRDWIKETIEQLQHYKMVQMWQQCLDLGPNGQVLTTHKGFVYSYLRGDTFTRQYGGWHPGFAWAATRDAIDGVGGLFDIAILGSGDDHMAKALIGKAADSLPRGLHPDYIKAVSNWEHHALTTIKKDIGYVPALIRHFWHGRKADRRYWSRWDILKKHKFSPYVDLKRDWQGLYQLTDRSTDLRDAIRHYFRVRNEDANTII